MFIWFSIPQITLASNSKSIQISHYIKLFHSWRNQFCRNQLYIRTADANAAEFYEHLQLRPYLHCLSSACEDVTWFPLARRVGINHVYKPCDSQKRRHRSQWQSWICNVSVQPPEPCIVEFHPLHDCVLMKLGAQYKCLSDSYWMNVRQKAFCCSDMFVYWLISLMNFHVCTSNT